MERYVLYAQHFESVCHQYMQIMFGVLVRPDIHNITTGDI